MKDSIKIIAGPCSINKENIEELFEIAKKGVWGVRVVGLKSRTYMTERSDEMGIDFLSYKKNVRSFISSNTSKDFLNYRSIEIAKKIIKERGVVVATEIVDPLIQLPLYEKNIPKNKLFIWNPAVNQLGYQTYIMGLYAKRNNWFMGIKNPKWLGKKENKVLNSMEKTWAGHISYALPKEGSLFMIHRGVDIKEKGKFRSSLVHSSAEKIKELTKKEIFFDPSHSFGPLLRDRIVKETIKAMKIKTLKGHYLYSGILIETGSSKTDKEQHITIKELEIICNQISKFRKIENYGK